MTEILLENEFLSAAVETNGGTIWRLAAKHAGGLTPLLRSPAHDAERKPRNSGCYPLLPFGNRIAGNRFEFDGKQYSLLPNVDFDPLCLHGDGWLSEWAVLDASNTSVTLQHRGEASGFPYRYDALQQFALDNESLRVMLRVVNRGHEPMPFGLGWHPYFPRVADTKLYARASSYWEEGALHLPVGERPLEQEIDFNVAQALPKRWVNNGFEGWDGRATITAPSTGVTTLITASDNMQRYFVFVPDPNRPPVHPEDFFAFEPMTHTANGHNIASGGGLVRLDPGQALECAMSIAWQNYKPTTANEVVG